MQIKVCEDAQQAGAYAADWGAEKIRQAIKTRGAARIVMACAASQIEMVASLRQAPGIDWTRVTVFHLDEYLGLDGNHPASFRKFLRERFCDKLPTAPSAVQYIAAEQDPSKVCDDLGKLLAETPIDVAFIGVGENSHLAFNDPPADFNASVAYHIVQLDEVCRRQQHKEGWYPTLEDVPRSAISMSVPEIMRCRSIVCTAPDSRKAAAVRDAVQGPVSEDCPASILQQHQDTVMVLDRQSASMLDGASN